MNGLQPTTQTNNRPWWVLGTIGATKDIEDGKEDTNSVARAIA